MAILIYGGVVPYNEIMMNDFQQKCLEVTQEILREKGIALCCFKEVIGKTQTYLMSEIILGGNRYGIYIYEDEAGLGINKKWFICEKPDFRSSQKLVQAFSRLLLEKLPPV